MVSTSAFIKPTIAYARPHSPGRFFAVNEVKAILAHLLLNYDFKAPGDSKAVPDPIWFGGIRNCNPKAQIMVKRRKV